ncbi:unnamed protein product [Boreogadus saida]
MSESWGGRGTNNRLESTTPGIDSWALRLSVRVLRPVPFGPHTPRNLHHPATFKMIVEVRHSVVCADHPAHQVSCEVQGGGRRRGGFQLAPGDGGQDEPALHSASAAPSRLQCELYRRGGGVCLDPYCGLGFVRWCLSSGTQATVNLIPPGSLELKWGLAARREPAEGPVAPLLLRVMGLAPADWARQTDGLKGETGGEGVPHSLPSWSLGRVPRAPTPTTVYVDMRALRHDRVRLVERGRPTACPSWSLGSWRRARAGGVRRARAAACCVLALAACSRWRSAACSMADVPALAACMLLALAACSSLAACCVLALCGVLALGGVLALAACSRWRRAACSRWRRARAGGVLALAACSRWRRAACSRWLRARAGGVLRARAGGVLALAACSRWRRAASRLAACCACSAWRRAGAGGVLLARAGGVRLLALAACCVLALAACPRCGVLRARAGGVLALAACCVLALAACSRWRRAGVSRWGVRVLARCAGACSRWRRARAGGVLALAACSRVTLLTRWRRARARAEQACCVLALAAFMRVRMRRCPCSASGGVRRARSVAARSR